MSRYFTSRFSSDVSVRTIEFKRRLRQRSCKEAFVLLSFYVILIMLLAGCQLRGYIDSRPDVTATRLDLPQAQYESMAWLSASEIALAYKQPEAREGTIRIALFDLESGYLEDIILPLHPSSCSPVASSMSGLSRLSNGNLGYIYFCVGNPGGYSGELKEWDRASQESTTLVRYPDFGPGPYSVSPDMSEVLQENAVGAILANELHLFRIGGDSQRILTDFKRAGSPSWASDGHSFIFAGTKSTPFDSPETFEDVEGLALSPWSIYEMSADQSQLRELLSGLNRPLLAWSPDGKRIAFTATYRDRHGTWLLDIDSGEVELIWEAGGQFAWSPDSNSLIVLDRDKNNGDRFSYYTYPTILALKEHD